MVISGHQWSSVVISGHQGSPLIRGQHRARDDAIGRLGRGVAHVEQSEAESVPDEGNHQRSSEAIRGHQRPSEILRGHPTYR